MSKLKEEKALNNKPCILIKRDRGALLHPKQKEMIMKRYEHQVDFIKADKADSEIEFKMGSSMNEQDDGEFVSIYDLPKWIRFWLNLW